MCGQCVAKTGHLSPPLVPWGPREQCPSVPALVCRRAPVPALAARLPAGVAGAAASEATGNID